VRRPWRRRSHSDKVIEDWAGDPGLRSIDWIGILLVAVGSSLLLLGHHWFGLAWFWVGALVMTLGLGIVLNEVRVRRFERNRRRHGGGAGDYGNTDYHSGESASGGDGGGSE
jgi:hypothetical protein